MGCKRPVCRTVPILVSCFVLPAALRASQPDDFVRLMNIGKAYIENRNSAKAIETLDKAVKLNPASTAAWRNLARAHLILNEPSAAQAAVEALGRASGLAPDGAATSYLTGIAHTRLSQFEQAVPHFEQAVRLDADTAALRYQLGRSCQVVGRHDEAKEQFRETIRLDPLHAGGFYALASYARKARDMAALRRWMREFSRVKKLLGAEQDPAAYERCRYTSPEAATGDQKPAEAGPAVAVRFVDATAQVFARPGGVAATAAAVLDVDEQGRCTLVVADSGGGLGLLTMTPAGKFRRVDAAPKPSAPAPFEGCIVGNFHDDVPEGAKFDSKVHAHNDLLLFGEAGMRLLKGDGRQGFGDVTGAAGLAGVDCRRACWVDYEHDGDLDLLLAREGGLELWQNNGDGRFETVTEKVGIGTTGPASDAAAVDLDDDVAIDIIAARGDRPTLVIENKRAGRFARMPEPPGPWPAARRVLANDLNNDGNMDAVLIAEKEATVLFGRTAQRRRLDLSRIADPSGVLVDYDNDGRLDFCAFGSRRAKPDKGVVRLWRNTGTGAWPDVTEQTGLASLDVPGVREMIAADVDADGDTDLMLLTADGRMRMLRNDGGHVGGQLKVRLVAIKTNQSGIGTRVELRTGNTWVVRAVSGLPIEIGLGGRKKLDSLQTVWTNGVVDNQIDTVVAARPVTILEKNVATGSCPFLYAWDGERYRFVTDILGNAPVGLSIERDVMLPADPDEYVYVGTARDFRPRDGRYVVEVTEEFREVLYLDGARIVAVDHPPDVEVHPTDKLMSAPFPPSELWVLGSRRPLISAEGSDGSDLTEMAGEIDGVFCPPGVLLPPPYRGMCYPRSITLDFGRLDAARPLVLAMTGWLQYGDASRNIAASQNSALTVIPPMLEVETASGSWQRLDLAVGMPAGKTKTILCDLGGGLPAGARRLRLTTTFEIRWDRLALFDRRPPGAVRFHEILPDGADLYYRGFSEIAFRRPGHPSTPDYDVVFDRPPWRTTPAGWCTRYGDVLELVARRDDKLLLVNAGDAVRITFDARALPALGDGLVRSFFFYSIGLEKDEDHNVVTGETVGPMPVAVKTGDDAGKVVELDGGDDWRLDYNTRYVPHDRFAPDR